MTSRPDYFADAQAPDNERRLDEIVSIGTVAEQDYSDAKAPRVRVKIGANVTDWLAWSSGSAGGNTDWQPLDVGEQVVMVAPGGDLAQAVIIGTVHKNDAEAPDKDPDVTARRWKDGSQQSFNRSESAWLLKLNSGGNFKIDVGDTVFTLKSGNVDIKTKTVTVSAPGGMKFTTSQLTVTGDVVAGGVSVMNHLHTKVQPGMGLSGIPLGGMGGIGGGMGGGGGPGTDGNGNDTASSRGDADGGTVGNGVPRDATGIYQYAVNSRIPYLSTAIDGAQEINAAFGFWPNNTFSGDVYPKNKDVITEQVYYERIRPSYKGYVNNLWQTITSSYDATTDTWTDDVIKSEESPIGRYYGEIPDGYLPGNVMQPGVQYLGFPYISNGGYNVWRSEGGRLYVKYGMCQLIMFSDSNAGNTVYYADVYWEISEEEFAENSEEPQP